MTHYKKGKAIIQRSKNGKFRKTTLKDFGISDSELQDGKAICANCKHVWMPILKTGECPKCGCREKQNPGSIKE